MSHQQGWVQQPFLEEFENLISSQESLAKQMDSVSIKEGEGSALMARQNFSRIKEIKIARVELVVNLLTPSLIIRILNVIGVAKLDISKDFSELNYKRVT